MFLRHRPADAAIHEHGTAVGCGTEPSLLEELAADPADFADLARVLGVDLDLVIATLVATRPATGEEFVARVRERIAAARPEASATSNEHAAPPALAAVPIEDPLRHVRALCASVAEHLADLARGSTSKDRRRSPSPWGGEERRGWGRWTRVRWGARVHRDGVDHPAEVTP